MSEFAKRLYHATTPWPLVADCLIWPDTKRWLRWLKVGVPLQLVPLAIVNTLVLKLVQKTFLTTKKVLNYIWPGAIMCELEETAGAWIVQCSCSAYYRTLPVWRIVHIVRITSMVECPCSVDHQVWWSVHVVRISTYGEVSSIFPSGRPGVFDLAIIISSDQF